MEHLLTVKQIADKLAIKQSTVYQWAHAGFIPCLRVGRCLRFDEKDIEKWINGRKIKGRIRYKLRV